MGGLLQPVVYPTEMLSHFAATEGIYAADESVEELTVVRDDDYCAVEVADGLLQHIL